MSYFVITGEEDGIEIRSFKSNQYVVDYIEDYYPNANVLFLDKFPDDMHELHRMDVNRIVIIKGEIVVPKTVKVVKQYKID